MEQEWTKRWGRLVRTTRYPGVLELQEGGYLLHAKIGRDKRVTRVVRGLTLRDAQRDRLLLIEQARTPKQSTKPLFSVYALSLYQRKVAQRDLKSAKTRERWITTLTNHLVQAFGSLPGELIRSMTWARS